jgi:thiosulfate/3-mercaptopyruvate sulfurtransferase
MKSLLSTLIKPHDLAQIPNKLILDTTYHLSNPALGHQNYLKSRIPNSLFFDLDKHSDLMSSFPHMMPSAGQFEEIVGGFGIRSADENVVVYDQHLFGSARVWYMFKYFGFTNVHVLDGGMKAYLKSGLELESGPTISGMNREFNNGESTKFKVGEVKKSMLIDYNELVQTLSNYTSFKGSIIDARNSQRFRGLVKEPRSIPSGHMPGSLNIPYDSLVDPDSGLLTTKDRLVELLQDKGVDLNETVISSCGSGVTACALLLALDAHGLKKVQDCRLYDGSWAEYASYKQSAIVSENTL